MVQFDPQMVAQMLMQPIQRATENLGGGPFGIGADAGGSYFVDPEVAARTGYGTAVTGTSFFPGAGIVDAAGGAVDITGQPLPSFSENISQGQFTDAGLQALGVAGDIATIAAPLTLGTSALVGAILKAPRAATKYKFENPIKVYQGRSKKGTKDFINPTDFYGDKKVSFGTNELVTAEQFANKQTVSYPGRARDGSEGPTKTTLIPGDVAELEFDIQNPLEVNRKDIGFKRDNEKAAIAEARAKGHDGLKIVYDNSDKIDYVAFDSEQVRVVNPSLYPDRDYAYSPTSAELADKATDVASDVAGIAKVEPPTDTQPGIIAFHGSGADFDEFKLDKIGTGEGAQAFGYGLYFSNNKDIGDFYKNALTRSVDIDGKPYIRGNTIRNTELLDPDIADELGAANGDLELAIKDEEEYLQTLTGSQPNNTSLDTAVNETQKRIEKLKALRGRVTINPTEGKTYKVAIQPKPEELLDYDLPLSEQPKNVQEFYEKFKNSELGKLANESLNGELDRVTNPTGERIYGYVVEGAAGKIFGNNPSRELVQQVQKNRDDYKLVTEELLKANIKGLKFKAGQLSGRQFAIPKETASENYVIFDDKIIKILEKYGIVGPVAVSATAASLREDDGST